VLEVVVFTTQRLGILVWALEHIAFLLCFAGIEVGLLRISLALQYGRNPRLADTFNHFNLTRGFLAAQRLYLAMVLAGLVSGRPRYLARHALCPLRLQERRGRKPCATKLQAKRGPDARRYGSIGGDPSRSLRVQPAGAALLGFGLFVTVPISVLMMSSIDRQLSATAPIMDVG
jgi:hypothetical protein